MTLKLGLLRDENKQGKSEFCDGLQSHTSSEKSLPNNSLTHLLRPQLSDERLKRKNEFKRIYSSTYQRCRQITSKAHEHRNRLKLGRPINTGQEVFLEDHTQDLTKSQKLKQLRVGPFRVKNQITITTYKIREYANLDNVKITHINHLIEYFPKEERLPPLITNYAVISRDSDFYKHLVKSQVEEYNSGKGKHSLDVMLFVMTLIQNKSDWQQKDDVEFSPRANSGINSPASSTQFSPRSQKSSPYENIAMFTIPQLQSHTFPTTPMPRQPHDIPNPIRDSQPSNSNTPPNSTSATDKGKRAHFATKVKKKYKRINPNSSLRKLERKGYKDYDNLLTIYNTYKFTNHLPPCAPQVLPNDLWRPHTRTSLPIFGRFDVCRCSPASRNPAGRPRVYATRHLQKGQQNWLTTETEHHCCKSRNIDYYTNQNFFIATQRTSISKRNLKKLKDNHYLHHLQPQLPGRWRTTGWMTYAPSGP